MPVRNLTSEFHVDRLREEVEAAIEKKWTVRFEKVRAKRSLSQNAYYWELLTIFGIHIGATKDEMHIDLRREYGLVYTNAKTGKKYLKSTTQLDTKEMTDYIDWIKNKAAQMGHELPSADYLKQHWAEHEAWKEEHREFIGETTNGS